MRIQNTYKQCRSKKESNFNENKRLLNNSSLSFSISYVLHLRIFDAVLRNNLTFPFTKAAKMERQALKIIHGFSNQVITSRRKELLEKNSQDSSRGASAEDSDLGIKKKLALLDVLLQSTVDGKPLSDADIREEVDTFIFEGHDTTASGVTFTLYCLGRHPDVQKRLVQEIHSVIGEDKQAPITLQLLNDMPYLESVIKEAMRLYPSVPMMGRMVEEDVVIGEEEISSFKTNSNVIKLVSNSR